MANPESLKLEMEAVPAASPNEGNWLDFLTDTWRKLGPASERVSEGELPSPAQSMDTARGKQEGSDEGLAPTGEHASEEQEVLNAKAATLGGSHSSAEPPSSDEIKKMDVAAIIGVLNAHPMRAHAVANCADALRILCRESANVLQATELGAIELIVQSMTKLPAKDQVQLYCLVALRNLVSGDNARKRRAVEAGGVPALCKAMAKHTAHAGICEHGYALATILGSITDASDEEELAIKRSFIDSGAYRTIAEVLNAHDGVTAVEQNACLAINTYARGEETHCEKAQQAGLIQRLATIVQRKNVDKLLWQASRAALGSIILDSAERKKEAKKCFPWGTVLL